VVLKRHSDLGKVFSLVLPDNWHVTPLDASIKATSPDMKATVEAMVTVGAAMPAQQWAQGMITLARRQNPKWQPTWQGPATVAGLSAWRVKGKGEIDGADTMTDAAFVRAGHYQAMIVTSVVPTAAQQYEKTILNVFQTFKFGAE